MKRRRFLKNSTGIGFGLAFGHWTPFRIPLSETMQKETRGAAPIVLCSRGERWGPDVNKPAWEILAGGGSGLDAVEAGANTVEVDPDDLSVGLGGLPNENGVVQLDASIMWGKTANAGAVAALEGIATACSIARLVMERTDHVMLVGKGAQQFAIAHGFELKTLLTEKARKRWLHWKETLSDEDDWFPSTNESSMETGEDYHYFDRRYGTINVLAVDQNQHIAGVTTTSGLSFKIPGRVGDSPIIGAGLYVDEAVGAAGATGRGEAVIKSCGSFLVVENMRRGMTPQKACEEACNRIIDQNGGNPLFNVKYVALNKTGEHGCAAIRGDKKTCPWYSVQTAGGFSAFPGKYLLESKG